MNETLFGEFPSQQSRVGIAAATSMGVDTFRLMSEQGQVNYVGLAVGTALRSFFPEDLSRSQLQSHPHQAEFFFAMTNLSVAVNNFMDLYPTANHDDKLSLDDAWRFTTTSVNRTIGKLPHDEQSYYKHVMNSYKREIVFLERYVRTNVLDRQELQAYRQIMNAINVWHLGAGLFTHDQIRSLGFEFMLKPHAGWSFEALKRKYQWMMSDNPLDGPQRKFAALFQVVMGMQLIDDAIDKPSDQRINAPTLHMPHNERMRQMDAYFRRAELFGVSKPLTLAIRSGFTGFKQLLTGISDGDRQREHGVFVKSLKYGSSSFDRSLKT
ncbi:MAG TPA: hypothetical protein VMR81_03925 [Patescibacteria group bacterium]|nr:hypothetical protein [Patescibacteria group bacterium]